VPANPAPNTTGTQQTTRTGDAQANPAANAYIPSNNAAVNKDVIKTDSPVGNASKGFASNEVVQTDKTMAKDSGSSAINPKNLAIAMIGLSVLADGGMINEAKAQTCADGGMIWHPTPEQGGGIMCVNGSLGSRPYGSHPDDGRVAQPQRPTNTRPVPTKPSSYGAVAWGNNYFGNSSNQTSKQNAINAALQKCGESSCQIANLYSNQCVAFASGINSKGAYTWQVSNGLTQVKAQKAALKDCNKSAKNCQVKFSECSLP
jgi:hypothetical protein